MKNKLVSLFLACVMVLSILPAVVISASALEPGGYDSLGTYTPSQMVKHTNHLMFAMPGAWQNDMTQNVGGAAGIYWWNGYDTCPDVASARNMHEWPGYMAEQVQEEGVDNLWAIDVPTYGNGEAGDAMTILWNNSLNSGTETDSAKNPFFDAAQQTKNIKAQYYCRNDKHKYYDLLFRYIYQKAMMMAGVEGAEELSLDSDTFWEDLNKLAAVKNGNDWDYLDEYEKTYQIDLIVDDMDEIDLSDFGPYASNFFNEDLVGYEIYPAEESNGDCLSFTFDNMVFVVDFDPAEMQVSDVSPKVGFGGDWFFYYGNGDYGTWPTKELNEAMAMKYRDNRDVTVVSGNIMSDYYWKPAMEDITIPAVPTQPATIDEPVSIDSGKIYFEVPSDWKNERITFYLNDHGTELITWGSKKGNMQKESGNIWSFDFSNRGLFFSGHTYCIFAMDWGVQTCDLIITPDNIGDTAYCTGNMVENDVDSNKSSYEVKWKSGKNGNPKMITSIGNIIGDTYFQDENAETIFYRFISTTDNRSIKNAIKFNGKSEQQTIDDTARQLGLSQAQVETLVNRAKAAGAELDWTSPNSGSNPGTSSAPKYSFTTLPDGTLALTDYNGTDKYVAIPSALKGEPIYIYSGDNSYSVTYEEIPVTAIGDWVFYNCKTLANVTIPDTITSIGKGAFYGCPRLTSVELPDSVTTLGANAFEKCLYLESVKLSENLTEIADETFFDCRRLKELNIPDGVTSIGEEAFYNCRSLTELVLPNSVQSVGKGGCPVGAFEDCRALSKIVLPDNVQFIEENAFEGCKKLTISAETGSYAAIFANENSLPFERMGGVTAQGNLIGDVSGDTTVNIEDASELQKFLAEFDGNTLDLSDPAALAFADVNRDGRVTIKDVTQIQRFLAEIVESF